MPDPSTTGIVEMGANHPGEIAFLCSIARPDYGLITNVGKAHLEGFGSVKGVARAKGELFDYLQENNGTVLLNEGILTLKDW
jgi:UDP-N-acetylmuramoyl-tripeptide--D-alanyl-D-alanine ligase